MKTQKEYYQYKQLRREYQKIVKPHCFTITLNNKELNLVAHKENDNKLWDVIEPETGLSVGLHDIQKYNTKGLVAAKKAAEQRIVDMHKYEYDFFSAIEKMKKDGYISPSFKKYI
jgi:hypothetical protein